MTPPTARTSAATRAAPRRTAANLTGFPQFPGFVGGDLANGDPHAMTVPYDVEALWVLDDLDSVWLNEAPDARATFPRMGDQPGINDNFRGNAGGGVGPDDFFAFHDYNPDFFFATGQGFPAPLGSAAAIPPDLTILPDLNSGVSGMQISVNAQAGQTILIRVLDAAYSNIRVTFPIEVVIIAFDGRALGVPPFGQYNRPVTLPARTPLELSTARRFDVLVRSATPVQDFASVEFRNHRDDELLITGQIPINIS